MKNCIDMPIFHSAVCAGATNSIYRRRETAYADFYSRSLRKIRSRMEGYYETCNSIIRKVGFAETAFGA